MQRCFLLMIAVVILQSINAQGVLKGLVTDKDTHEPIIGVTLSGTSWMMIPISTATTANWLTR